jgi:hypothetical protein
MICEGPTMQNDWFTAQFAERIQNAGKEEIIKNMHPSVFNTFMEMFSGNNGDDFNIFDILEERKNLFDESTSPFAALVSSNDIPPLQQLANALETAYRNTDILLRKYEERIVTLPTEYSSSSKNDNTGNAPQEFSKNLKETLGIKLNYKDDKNPQIKYCRHIGLRGQTGIYAEALSGSQSYLIMLQKALQSSAEENYGLFVRLVENAFTNLLVIDERVWNFLKAHQNMADSFKAMNIKVADTSELSPINNNEDIWNICKKEDIEKCNMLIIHQGVIDKVLPSHDSKQVGDLIETLQKKIPYTVITTGRGRPDNIPDSAKVIPFSMVESTLFQKYPEKMLLVNAVMNCLPYKKD